jgi:hypothetical protein
MANHWLRVDVEIEGEDSTVMGWGVVLRKVVTQVCVTWGPAGGKCSLLNAVLDPVVTHVHSLGPSLENCFVCNSICFCVVGFDLCCILWVSRLSECFARYSSRFGIDKQGTILGFSDGGHKVFEDNGFSHQGSV